MGKKEKKQFVVELAANVVKSLLEDIDNGKVPEYWDGHELRHLLAHRFSQQTFKLSPPRKRQFKNTLFVNDL